MTYRCTPLHFAVDKEHVENANFLLRNGAFVNAKDELGHTAMHFAVIRDNIKLVKILEQYGANATITNNNGCSAIDLCISQDQKALKNFFMSQNKYANYDFSGINLTTGGDGEKEFNQFEKAMQHDLQQYEAHLNQTTNKGYKGLFK